MQCSRCDYLEYVQMVFVFGSTKGEMCASWKREMCIFVVIDVFEKDFVFVQSVAQKEALMSGEKSNSGQFSTDFEKE